MTVEVWKQSWLSCSIEIDEAGEAIDAARRVMEEVGLIA
jgi:hypothetical protein